MFIKTAVSPVILKLSGCTGYPNMLWTLFIQFLCARLEQVNGNTVFFFHLQYYSPHTHNRKKICFNIFCYYLDVIIYSNTSIKQLLSFNCTHHIIPTIQMPVHTNWKFQPISAQSLLWFLRFSPITILRFSLCLLYQYP